MFSTRSFIAPVHEGITSFYVHVTVVVLVEVLRVASASRNYGN